MNKDDKKRTVTPKLRFPEFRKGKAWEETTIGGVCDLRAGKFVAASEIAELPESGLFPCYGGNGLRGYTKSFTHEGHFSLIGRLGALCGNVRLFAGRFHATEHALVVTPNDEVNTDWLFYALGLLELNQYAIGQAQPGLSVGVLEKVSIASPSNPAEQQKIADCLTSLDECVAAQGRKVEALKAHKKGLMQQLFPREGETLPRLRFPEFRDAPEWESHTLGNIVTISKGKGVAKADVVENGQTPCIRYAELYTAYGEVISDVRSRTNVPVDNLVLSEAGDVIIPASGETKEDIATCACVLDAGIALGSDLNVLRSAIDGRFFSYYLNGSKRAELATVAQGDTVAHLYPSQISQLAINLPSDLAEQQRIANCLSSLDARLAAETEKLAALKLHKKGLMQQLFPSPGGA